MERDIADRGAKQSEVLEIGLLRVHEDPLHLLLTQLTSPSLAPNPSVEEAKVACFQEDFQLENSDTKGKVLLKKASELENCTKSEEDHLEEIVKSIADKGIKCVESRAEQPPAI